MVSVEQRTKAKFARLFTASDWKLFKRMAEFHLERAARVRRRDMKGIAKKWRLLARNSEKRLFMGIGTELLLKALYLKAGFAINRPRPGSRGGLSFPFTFAEANDATLAADDTYTMNDLVEKVSRIPGIGQEKGLGRGLKIAKVFRNKEGHGVLDKHTFDPQDYRDVEAALTALYDRGFGESLRVRISMKPNEKAAWSVERRRGRTRP
jgi:hypothetical protein